MSVWITVLAVFVALGIVGAAIWFASRRGSMPEPAKPPESEVKVPEGTLPETVAPATAPSPEEPGEQISEETCEAEPAPADSDEAGSEEAKPANTEIPCSPGASIPTLDDIPEEAFQTLEKITHGLPKLPGMILDVLPLLSRPGAGASDIARVIQRDQVTAARLLRWVNSSFYGLEGKVTSLHRAVVIIGMDIVRTLVLEDAFSRGSQLKECTGLSTRTIWRHAAAASIAAKFLGRHSRGIEPDVAATAGLLHDVGMLLLLITEPEKLEAAVKLAKENGHLLVEYEHELIGYNHQAWGELFIRAWRLPDEIAFAVGRHHCPMQEPANPLAGLIWLADYMVSRLGFACPHHQVPFATDDDLAGLFSILGLRLPLERYFSEGLIREIIGATKGWTETESRPDEPAVAAIS